MGIFDFFKKKKNELKSEEKTNKKASELKEFLISNNCTIKLKVFEELDSSFQIRDSDGNVFSPNDSALRIDEETDLNDDELSWNKGEKIYRDRIFRDQSFEFEKNEFIEYLDEFIEEGHEEEDLEEFSYWVYDKHGMSFEECAGGGSCEQMYAYGQKENYLVDQYIMHEQNVYELRISIE